MNKTEDCFVCEHMRKKSDRTVWQAIALDVDLDGALSKRETYQSVRQGSILCGCTLNRKKRNKKNASRRPHNRLGPIQ